VPQARSLTASCARATSHPPDHSDDCPLFLVSESSEIAMVGRGKASQFAERSSGERQPFVVVGCF
jgi:hypothetical protein